MEPKTYKIRGVEFKVNEHGFLMSCSDWESIYEPKMGEAHRGTNVDLVMVGFGGALFVTDKFWDEVKAHYGEVR